MVHCWEDVLGDDERLVAQAYTGIRHVRARRGLLLVDLYNRAFGREGTTLAESVETHPSSCGPAAWAALPVLHRLLHCARQADVPVVHTAPAPYERTGATLRVDRAGHEPSPPTQWDDAIVEPLTPLPGELVLPKARASAFFGTVLDAHLRRLGVDALLVAGESTSGCVRATVVDAHSLGFDVVVVEEATFDRSPLSHKVNLFDLHCKYATVVHADDAMSFLADPDVHTVEA